MKNGDNNLIYVRHMLAEHRRLDQLIRRTLASIPNWEEVDVSSWLPRVQQGLASIRAELAHHFRDEEQGGCLEEAVAQCPGLSAEVQRIEAQHGELLADLDLLMRRIETHPPTSAAEIRVLEAEFRQIIRELRSHEACENRILQRGFSVCLENEDMAADQPESSRV